MVQLVFEFQANAFYAFGDPRFGGDKVFGGVDVDLLFAANRFAGERVDGRDCLLYTSPSPRDRG